MKLKSSSLTNPGPSIALAFLAMAFLTHDVKAAQRFEAVPNGTSESTFAPSAVKTGKRGFEVVPMQAGSVSKLAFSPVDQQNLIEPALKPANMVQHYYSAADTAALSTHDVWPNQAWTLVQNMPWPTSIVEIEALRPIPILRASEPISLPATASTQQANATPPNGAAADAPTSGAPGSGAPASGAASPGVSPSPTIKSADSGVGLPTALPPPPPIPQQAMASPPTNGMNNGNPRSSVLPIK